jgi:hypothetical protein
MALPSNPGGFEYDPKSAQDELAAQKKITEELKRQAEIRSELLEKVKDMSPAAMREAGVLKDIQEIELKRREALTSGQRQSESMSRNALAIQNLGLAGVDAEIAKRAAARASSTNQMSVLSGMVQEQMRLNAVITASESTDEARVSAAKQLFELSKRHGDEVKRMASDVGSYEKTALQKGAPSAATKLLESPGMIGDAARSMKFGLGAAREEKEQAEHGTKMSFGAAASSAGIQGLVAVIGTIAPAMLSAASTVDIFGSILRTVLAALDEGRMVHNRTMQAWAMGSDKALAEINLFGDGTADAIRRAAGVTETQAVFMGSAYDDLRDGAQAATLGINVANQESKNSVVDFTGELIKAGMEGQTFGIETSKSMQLVVGAAKAFGLSGKDARTVFEHMALGAKVAGLSIGDFNSSLGESVDWGKKFGDQGGMYESMARAMHGIRAATGASTLDMMQMGGAVAGLAKDPTKMLGLRSSFAPGGQDKAIKDIFSAANTGGKVGQTEFDLALNTAAGFLHKQQITVGGKSMSAMDALRKTDNPQAQFAGAQMAAQVIFNDPSMWAKFGNEKFLSGVEKMFSGKELSKAEKDAVSKEMKGDDLQKKGFNAMMGSRDALKIISETLTSMAKVVVHIGTAAVFNSGGYTAEAHAAERSLMKHKTGSGRMETAAQRAAKAAGNP